MTQAAVNIDQIVQNMQEPVKTFVARVQELGGPNCLAITAFGTIATPAFDPTKHTAKSVVVLDQIDLSMLRELAKEGVKLGKAKISAPLIMTPGYIKGSLDAFPLEFLEIQQCHVCLMGADFFKDLSFDTNHIRLQSERELKTILIAMRQGLLAAAGREKMFGAMESDIAERLIRTLRGLLWLHGTKDFLTAIQVVGHIEQETDRTLPGIRKAFAYNRQHDWDDFTTLYHEIDGLKTLADRW
ncbi:hypothetical protein [Candidatus Nitronereus thalassa]|uniref:Nucleotidyltransferase n=1 Tax=Candidatus Nitronereus thalassa TaxID=3020898 RepID=A0ABU3K8I6_9BACT|nr:hypothetical protein [Candidatus Nitronereus thalassa]MDT7042705.1 hypothetical protein [Candidatus Nitronereus thalassa]